MGIWRDTSNSSVFGLLAGSPHSEFSPANSAWHMQILPCVLCCFFSLSAQLGKWAAIQIQFAAVSQKMLTQTNQPKACVARKQSYYASLPFACIHSSDFLINIPYLNTPKKFPLQAGTESSPLQVPQWFNLTSDCWCKWLQLFNFGLAGEWQNSYAHMHMAIWKQGQLSFAGHQACSAFCFSSRGFFLSVLLLTLTCLEELTCLLVIVQPYPEGNSGKIN